MDNLNKSWVSLILIGIFFLFLLFVWDVYQNLSGSSSEFTYTATPLDRNILFTKQLEDHLNNSEDLE